MLVGATFVNYELAAQGYATAATYPPDVACAQTFLAAEQAARNAGLGMWSLFSQVYLPLVAQNLDPAATPSPSPTAQPNCDPSYPTVCIPPPPPDLDCGDIPYRNFTVLPPDPHNFDGNHDGVGCEGP